MIVYEFKHFTVLTGHLRDAAAQLRIAVAMENRLFGSVRSVRNPFRRGLVKLVLFASAAGRESLEPRDRQDPGRDLRTVFEGAGLPPHAKEDLADQIFRVASVGYETDDETKNANMVPPVQRPHSGLAPFRNRLSDV
jgi:hypothetical protein